MKKRSNCCGAVITGDGLCMHCKDQCVQTWGKEFDETSFLQEGEWEMSVYMDKIKDFIKDKMKEMADEMIGEYYEGKIEDLQIGYNTKRDEIINISKKYVR